MQKHNTHIDTKTAKQHYFLFKHTCKILVQECKIYVLGFVPADVVRLKEDVWFSKLGSEQISSVEQFLSEHACMD